MLFVFGYVYILLVSKDHIQTFTYFLFYLLLNWNGFSIYLFITIYIFGKIADRILKCCNNYPIHNTIY